MAELIEQIVSEKAFEQVNKLKAELAALQKQMEALAKGGFSAPAGSSQATQALSEMEKLLKQTTAAQERLAAMQTVAGQKYTEAAQSLREYNAQLKNANRENNAAEGSLDQMQAKLKGLQERYRAMGEAARNGVGGQELLKNLQAQYTAVTNLEKAMGQYQRNVGNYSNATFQLSQVFRELPAFTYSAQTGVMALSNNLPMLADAFRQVSMATNETTGKVNGTMGALKIFGASIFSLGNIFTIAMSAFLIFNKEIMNMIGLTDKAEQNATGFAKSLEEVSSAAASEIVTMQNLYRVATDVTMSMEERLYAVNKLQESYPAYLGNLSDEAILAGQAQAAYEALTDAMIDKAIFQAFEKEMEPLAASIAQMVKVRDDLIKQRDSFTGMATSQASRTDDLSKRQENYNKAIENQNVLIQTAKDQMQDMFNSAKEYFSIVERGSKKVNEVKKRSGRNNDKEFRLIPPNLDPTLEEIESIQKYYDKLEKERIRLIGEYFNTPEVRQAMEDEMKMADVPYVEVKIKPKMTKEDYLEALSIIEDFYRSFQDIANTYNDAVSAKEQMAFDRKTERMKQFYEEEELRINRSFTNQKEKETELQKLTARKLAEEKASDIERRKIQREQAIRQKKLDVMAATTATALAIIKAFTEGDPYTKVARAALAAATGAAQIARAAAAPLPEFAKGTDNSPEGYAVVGEKGHELVVEPSGKKWVTPAKDTITYLKKGSKVIPNDKLMDMVKNSAYVELANMTMPVTPDLYGKALIDQFERLSDDVKDLKAVMSNKDMRVNIIGNFDHYMHVKKNIK